MEHYNNSNILLKLQQKHLLNLTTPRTDPEKFLEQSRIMTRLSFLFLYQKAKQLKDVDSHQSSEINMLIVDLLNYSDLDTKVNLRFLMFILPKL
jgi:hypothetical protein